MDISQHLNFQFRYFGNCLDVDALIILHIKDHKVMDNITCDMHRQFHAFHMASSVSIKKSMLCRHGATKNVEKAFN